MRLIFLLMFVANLSYAGQIEDYCAKRNGTIYTKYRCPKTGLNLPIKTCEYTNEDGDLQFINGCSGPSGGHGDLFFRACVKHDLCYHHEPSTSGMSRKDCDQLFLEVATESCYELPKSKQKSCTSWAKTMYRALRIVGGLAYRCDDRPANY